MKHKGSRFEYAEERDADLLRAYREVLTYGKAGNIHEIAAKIAQSPSKRFWVSEERADMVIGHMLAGRQMHCMTECKKRMYTELYKRYLKAKEMNPNATRKSLMLHICSSRAPEFYMTPGSIVVLLHRIRRKLKKEWRERFARACQHQ